MVKEMKNNVVVEGILSEIGLERYTYTDSKGVTQDAIRGDLTIRVTQEINKGEPAVTLEVPVGFFSRRLTNAGNENSSYTALEKILSSGNSIAVVGEDKADCLRITGASLKMREYFNQAGKFTTFPLISASFVTPIKRSDMVMKAKFDTEMVIAKMELLTDKDGVELHPQTLGISGIIVGYNEYTDIVTFMTKNPAIITSIQNSYSKNDTISLSGVLNFSSSTETFFEQVEIGEPIERQKTVRVSEMIIRGVSPRDVTSEEYDLNEIKACLAKRTERHADLETKFNNKKTAAATPRTKENEKEQTDLGF